MRTVFNNGWMDVEVRRSYAVHLSKKEVAFGASVHLPNVVNHCHVSDLRSNVFDYAVGASNILKYVASERCETRQVHNIRKMYAQQTSSFRSP